MQCAALGGDLGQALSGLHTGEGAAGEAAPSSLEQPLPTRADWDAADGGDLAEQVEVEVHASVGAAPTERADVGATLSYAATAAEEAGWRAAEAEADDLEWGAFSDGGVADDAGWGDAAGEAEAATAAAVPRGREEPPGACPTAASDGDVGAAGAFGELLCAAAVAQPPAACPAPRFPPATRRAWLHVDADAFYAQVEELRNPRLAGRPLAVQQKHIVVTSNYAARARGVGKLMRVTAALAACPELALVSGEDLTPYRAASAALAALLAGAGVGPVTRGGLDEAWIDATAAAGAEAEALAAAGCALAFVGRVHRASAAVGAPNRYRPMDVVADEVEFDGGGEEPEAPPPPERGSPDALLAAASAVAARLQARVAAGLGLRVSVGVAHSPALAKLAGGLHKPAGLTSLPSAEAAAFLAPLSARALPGVGSAGARALLALPARVATVGDLRAAPPPSLAAALGRRAAAAALRAAWGAEPAPGGGDGRASLPRSLSVEDSFAPVRSRARLDTVLATVLAPDLAARAAEEAASTGRLARTLTLRWRTVADGGGGGGGGARLGSASAPAPAAVRLGGGRGGGWGDDRSRAAAADAIAAAASSLLRARLTELRGGVTRLSVGLGGFTHARPAAAAAAAADADSNGAAPVAPGDAQPAAAGAGAAAAAGAALAAASAAARRLYDGGGVAGGGGCAAAAPPPALLAKRAERAAREVGRDVGGGALIVPPPAPSLARPASAAAVAAASGLRAYFSPSPQLSAGAGGVGGGCAGATAASPSAAPRPPRP